MITLVHSPDHAAPRHGNTRPLQIMYAVHPSRAPRAWLCSPPAFVRLSIQVPRIGRALPGLLLAAPCSSCEGSTPLSSNKQFSGRLRGLGTEPLPRHNPLTARSCSMATENHDARALRTSLRARVHLCSKRLTGRPRLFMSAATTHTTFTLSESAKREPRNERAARCPYKYHLVC
jgi:hypothetical protein